MRNWWSKPSADVIGFIWMMYTTCPSSVFMSVELVEVIVEAIVDE
jgi:hypothetical protein